MKKLVAVLVVSLCAQSLSAWDWFEKNISKPIEKKIVKPVVKETKKAVETVKTAFANPEKTAKDAAYSALKTVGININGIVSNVNSIKTTVPQVSKDVAAIQKAVNAPMGPIKQATPINTKMKNFQAKADALQKQISVNEIKKAIASPQGLLDVLQKVTSNKVQTGLRDLSQAYGALVTNLDSVEIRPILKHTKATLLDIAGVLDSALKIRDYSGTLAKVIISANLGSALNGVSASLRKIAANLDSMIKGGRREIASATGELAGGMLSNLQKIPTLITEIQKTAKGIPPHISKVKVHVNNMVKLKDKLVNVATNIDSRLEKLVLAKVKSVVGTFDVPRAAVVELKKIINEMKNHIDGIMRNATDAIAKVADAATIAVDGSNAFKNNLGFDILPPRSRAGFVALPGNIKGLSQNVDRVRRALP